MRIITAAVLLPGLLAAAGFEMNVSITPDLQRIDVTQNGHFTRVTGWGMELISTPGEPVLPVYTEMVALPTGCSATEATVMNAEYQAVPGRHEIAPQQVQVPLSSTEPMPPAVPPDPVVYGSSQFFPGAAAELAGSGVVLGIPVAYIKVHPARWNPTDGSLELLQQAELRVSCVEDPAVRTVSVRSSFSETRSMAVVEKLAVNPSGVSGSGAVIVDSRELEWGEYVIIATQAYAAKAQELADWKTAKGIPTSVITTDWISSTYTGCDLQQKMRAFLTDARDQGVEFVLIYGDDDVVPCRDGLLGYYSGPEIAPVDMYFSDINDLAPGADLWDSNGNDIWCEYGFDIVDYHPDLWVGRASVNTMDECDIFNEKVFLYEGVLDTDYFESSEREERIGYTTELLWPGCYGSAGAELISAYVPNDWEEEKCYDSQGDNNYYATRDMLNAGPHHVYHASHGNSTAFSLPGGMFTTSDFMNLTNIADGGLPAIWNSISCLIGHLDNSECMGDAWLNSPDGGGFGAFNARFGFGNPSSPGYGISEVLCRYFYDVMWNDDLFRLGVAHAMGNDAMFPISGETEDWCVKEYNLFGDPELPMWFSHPDTLTAVHDNEIWENCHITVTVTAEGLPVSGARVCLQKGDWKEGDIYQVASTGSSGEANFYVTPQSTGEISVVAWARDHVSYIGTISVTGTGIGGTPSVQEPCITSVYPVPAMERASVGYAATAGETVTAQYFDLSGRCVKSETFTASGAESSCVWELMDESGGRVPSGIYCVMLSGNSWSDVSTIAVVR